MKNTIAEIVKLMNRFNKRLDVAKEGFVEFEDSSEGNNQTLKHRETL